MKIKINVCIEKNMKDKRTKNMSKYIKKNMEVYNEYLGKLSNFSYQKVPTFITKKKLFAVTNCGMNEVCSSRKLKKINKKFKSRQKKLKKQQVTNIIEKK